MSGDPQVKRRSQAKIALSVLDRTDAPWDLQSVKDQVTNVKEMSDIFAIELFKDARISWAGKGFGETSLRSEVAGKSIVQV
jgi:hypothetical protein